MQDDTQTLDRDASKTAKFLANLKRNAAAGPAAVTVPPARDPDDEPAALPPPPPPPAPKAVAPKPAKSKPRKADDDEVSMSIKLDPGTGKRVVYVRVDKTLADRLQLIAFQNKIANTDGPRTINDIGIEALHEWLANREGRAAA